MKKKQKGGIRLCKKHFIRSIIIIVLSVVLVGCSVGNLGNQNRNREELGALQKDTLLIDVESTPIDMGSLNQYKIEAELNTNIHQLIAKQSVSYVNNTQEELKEIYFNLYPNAFKDKDTAPILFDQTRHASKYEAGYIELNNLKVNDEKNNYEISGIGETLLKIPLEEPLQPHKVVDIYMEYTIQVPNVKERFGVWEGVYNFGNWYPVAAVYDHRGWNLEPYYSIGDPFYSEVGNYDVTLILPEKMELAASGNITSHMTRKNKRIWKIESKLMRDFAWCSSEDFEVEEVMVGDTVVKMYYLTNDPQVREKAKEYAVNSLKTFNEVYQPYPYGYYSVVETNFPSGMEYPGLVYVGRQHYDKNRLDSLELIIVHETAHQWWYGVVGNDQVNEAWLDESLTTYSELAYYRNVYDEEKGIQHHQRRNQSQYEVVKEGFSDKRILRPLSEFDGWSDYGTLVYSHGANMLYHLEEQYGEDKLYEILKTYYHENQFKVATSEDFIRITEEILSKDQEIFFGKWLLGQ
ncbi:M1 family metallopeptidase [Alkaliphilus hydrothermalis]|uniref:Peptidase M1 membrane alanine aminopeptidase domain-containing protein n=1 Tax=Alkaliphilus hydrothermalis TaxID=1482730 RepID=A0ABS2NP46_9FIRM|nr:M1 family metallopeptidase [Alkaliphilus hydrothermalis]MBM7614682.1 hypothetical protein [Alkaliphilus hydrothermalis]